MKLHIGCFNVTLDGWYNTDVTPHIFIARVPYLATVLHSLHLISDEQYEHHRKKIFRNVHYLNSVKRFPFQDTSIDAIYSSHMLVNFTKHQAAFCLSECYRVLKLGGILRIAIPDLDQWIRSYDPMNPDKTLSLFYLPTIKRVKNHIHWMYNAHSLALMLSRAGFSEITQCKMYEGMCLNVKTIDYREDSIFFEAVKI
jgi:ubiquinone/menaquinone biosynthesis C-methylase UbiE